jgi:hypothetical protein
MDETQKLNFAVNKFNSLEAKSKIHRLQSYEKKKTHTHTHKQKQNYFPVNSLDLDEIMPLFVSVSLYERL